MIPKDPPDRTHLLIEALLRGNAQLLPSERPYSWTVSDSTKRNEMTKILRLCCDGAPYLAFERLGRPLNFWTFPFAVDGNRLSTSAPVERNRGFNANGSPAVNGKPGWHSNVDGFFGKPDQLWFFQFTEFSQAIHFLELIS